ncbi:beta-ketoacyl-[acyl-carrier-protein] synthase family protein [Raineyella sp.]|uniref:3-oxoacyl-[acyl-carrier-protein] synthase 1 n=1 Tax=bioreactor metagenome TaxID=1076179 RepID=A0A644YQY8_9ZZZZ|nr:beta-ketoacyl-[acyl-carrier-protein] synthase family protein [Raineyella sp.]MEA5154089.1 beta-ketoacyl-[acyl-carrier-protein] synthase family protein [Raineyella sp.]
MSSTVVVTGFGATTPLGGDAATTWANVVKGTPGVHALPYDWAQDLPTRIAAEAAVDPTTLIDRVEARKMDRSTQLGIVAALEAWQHAGFGLDDENPVDPTRLAVSVGTGIGGLHTLIGQWDVQKEKGHRRVSPFTIPKLMANAPAATVGLRLRARAGIHTPVSACASGNEAIAQGLDIIRLGRADVVVVGGAEGVIHPLPVAAFGQMQALSRRNDEPEKASRPWDKHRDGFVLGEGAAMLVLESLEHAIARGATIYATLAGAGVTSDAYDMVAPDPDGVGQSEAVRLAVLDGGLQPGDVKHVNAHATSTPAGDLTEVRSVRSALGDATDDVIFTGTKSQTGHLLGAAGAMESIFTVLALKNRIVPPTINLEDPEDSLDIDIATTARELPQGDIAAINNSFGFGGHNVALAFTTGNITEG